MKRILHIVDSMGMGGIQAFIMNVYRNIDRTKIQFDFMLNNCPDNNYDEEIKRLGGEVFYLPARNKGILKNRRALDAFFIKHQEYDVVHMHESSLTYIEPLVAAKKRGVSTIIIHAHSTRASGNKIHTLLHVINRKRISKIATDYFACGELAKKWMYKETTAYDSAVVVNNGIRLKDFEYNESIRESVRKELDIERKMVIGHIGRFSKVKNHSFLIDLFAEYHRNNPESTLILVGDGELRSEIERRILNLEIEDSVYLLGNRKDVNHLLQGFDLVIIPSLYEGFPVCVIEAQASGVPCIMSSSITEDAMIKANTKMFDLSKGPIWWAQHIEKAHRIVENKDLYSAGYDIDRTIHQLELAYGLEIE